ncbi:MAG: DUF1449 family protein, partial [Tannerellaceae bacterium]|nr:DUF1449 family protein [Tannerellaceae bacterium]
MNEIFSNLMHPLPNAVMTVIMGILCLYWIVTFLFGIGFEDIDLGFELDVEVPDVDVDMDADVALDADGDIDTADPEGKESTGAFMKFLQFMNIGRVPFMLVLSTFKFFIWVGSLITTQFINVASWGLISIFILLPLAVLAVFFTRFATNPMARFFEKIGYHGEQEVDFLGRSGRMLSTIRENKTGYAEVVINKNPYKLYVRSIDGK